MSIYKITLNPPEPTPEEYEKYFYGKSGTQFARKNKKTGEIEYWWTGDNGHWSQYFGEMEPFICKPRLKINAT